MDLYEKSLNEYLVAAASKHPTPGGGGVSAVVAANAAAMISMVANLTLERDGYEEVQKDAEEVLEAAEKIISRLKNLTAKDMSAYQAYRDACHLPSNSEEEENIKKQTMHRTITEAILIPIEICRECLNILDLAIQLTPIGNRYAISDAGVGIHLAHAALRASMLCVEANLPQIHDAQFKADLLLQKEELLSMAEKLETIALAEVIRRM
jgi:methenyltetrahydrofolate cyclohydrolase